MRRELLSAARVLARMGLVVAALAAWLVLDLSPAQAGHPMAGEPAFAVQAADVPARGSPCVPERPSHSAANHFCASCAPVVTGVAMAGAADAPVPPAVARLPRWSYRAAALRGGDVAPLYRPP
jgi:hypothetical protein